MTYINGELPAEFRATGGYKHRDCYLCGTEIGFNESAYKNTYGWICFNCELDEIPRDECPCFHWTRLVLGAKMPAGHHPACNGKGIRK